MSHCLTALVLLNLLFDLCKFLFWDQGTTSVVFWKIAVQFGTHDQCKVLYVTRYWLR